MLFISDRIVTSNNFSEKQIEFITRHTSDSMNIVQAIHLAPHILKYNIVFKLFTELNAMSYRYTLEEILQFSNDKLSNFSVTSFVWNTMNEVGIQFIIWIQICHRCIGTYNSQQLINKLYTWMKM